MKATVRTTLTLVCALIAASALADENARVIVKYRSSSSVLAQGTTSRAKILSSRTGESVSTTRTIAPRMDVVQASGISSAKLAARLAAQSDVEYAVPDRLKKIQATPNDPLFSTQWNLLSAQVSAINAQGAWALSTGSSSVVVAVVDTDQEAIAEITSAGALVVVASGNEGKEVDEPANCSGVLAVAGIRHAGTKVGYSSFGPEVGISAPAGNCGSTSGNCLYPIITAKNSGTTTAVSSSYSDSSDPSFGTSFAAPQAAGVAALMLAGNSGLSPAKLISLVKASATAFPTDPTLKSCNVETGTSVECNCTTTTCGAGMLNALAAVTLALKPSASITTVSSATAGTSLTLDGSGSSASGSRTIASYAWSVTSGSGIVSSFTSTDQAKAVLLPSAAGTITVSLTVTDSEGLSDTTSTSFTVAAASTTTGGTTGGTTTTTSSGGGGGALDPLALIALLSLAGLTALRRR